MHSAIRWRAVIFCVYLAVQIGVPIYRLFQPKPTRFSWQMFSAASVPKRVWVVTADGIEEISPAAYIGNFRADLEYERYAPPHICRVRPQTKAVRYLMPLDDNIREYRC